MVWLQQGDSTIMENIFYLAYQCLTESCLEKKLKLSADTVFKILNAQVDFNASMIDVVLIKPGRPDKPNLISPKDLPKRNIHTLEGRAAMIHSFAHIEFNAINLAWDLIYRFREMPSEFYLDWARVADEETKHFILLRNNLMSINYDYGDFPAHDGLWNIAEQTTDDILLRLAVVPRILEARGLDVTPDLINRFREVKDEAMVSILEVILKEEIGHVQIGSKWFRFLCEQMQIDPEEKFRVIMDEFIPANKTKKINYEARLLAGFSKNELDYLVSI
jgi:uncharacterized ferritin-like protein (DUF455 family)